MPTDPNRVKEIFLEATEQPDEAARTAYLERACGGDAGLRDRVEALLRSHDPAGSFLGSPAVKAPEPHEMATQDVSSAPTPEDDNEANDDLKFLDRPRRADSLGRLGHYEVLQVLGKGGFGIVFRAFDDTLQRVVAVKVMAPQIATLSPARKRFLREAQSSAAVRHENVVQIYEVGEQPLPYLVMEFVPGETLQQKLNRSGPLDVPEVLRIGRQVAEGLAAAHASDLIHRDIKPGNILLEGGSHKVKITDFGLARTADDASISQSGIVAGTPMFMAPEQALGQHIDRRADLFSLGSVLYQMVSGRPPFRAPTALAVLKRVAEEPPRPIPEIIPETPDWLCGIITKLHAKNPDDRFQSAREVADLLADCEAKLKAKQEVKNVLPATRDERRGARGAKKWLAAAVVVLLPMIALAVTEFAGVTHLFRQSDPTPIVNTPPNGGKPPAQIDPIKDQTPVASKYALKFEDKDDAVNVADDVKLDLEKAITFETWVKFNVLPSAANRTMILVAKSMFRNDLDLIAHTDDRFRFFVGAGPFVRSKTEIEVGQWYHVAATYRDGDVIEIFVNGKLEGSRPIVGVRREANMYPLTIGSASIVWPDRVLAGMIHGVRISRTARYGKDFTPEPRFKPDPDTIALFNFDEGAGDTLKDSSGNGHHSKIVGAKWVNRDGTPVAGPATLPPTYKNSIGMEFVIVPKGKSWLGGGGGKLGDNEVVIPADFYLGKYEVTQEEWEKVMGENPSHFSRNGGGMDAVKDIPDADLKRFPVENVSWDQCQIFVEKLNRLEKETGWVYRLPKEVEWEYACRGGPMSDKLDSAFDFYLAKPTNTLLPEQANFKDSGLNRPCKVGSYAANTLGLFDMHGNVSEWCVEIKTQGNRTFRYLVSGHFQFPAQNCRATWRYLERPEAPSYHVGLRLARVPSGVPSPEAKTPAPPPAPSIHDTWLKAVALLPLDQHAAALPAKLQERLPGFDDAFLTAIPAMAADRQAIMAEAWLKERKPAFAGFEDAWLKAIPLVPADTQVVLVAAWLKECNHGFDGEMTPKIEGGLVTSLEVPSPLVQDLRPLRTLTGLRSLTCLNPVGYDNRAESDAAVLRSLKKLETINGKPVAQFWKEVEARPAQFKEWLQLVSTLNANQKVAAVAVKLKERNPGFDGDVAHKIVDGVVTELTFKSVRDLSPLRALEGLTALNCTDSIYGPLSDLSPLKGMPLTSLNLSDNIRVGDLSPLKGMKLTNLDLNSCWQVRDLEPLKGMPLEKLNLRGTKMPNVEALAGMPLTSLSLAYCSQIQDLSPLKGMPLISLDLYTCQVQDLEPLKGMALTYLFLADCPKVHDLGPLKGMPLTFLMLNLCPQVQDLAPLKGMPLTDLYLWGCNQVRDLAPLKGMPLKRLSIIGAGVTDLSPLQGVPLEFIALTPKNITQGLEILRDMKSLKTISSANGDTQRWPAAEFWDRYDKGEFK